MKHNRKLKTETQKSKQIIRKSIGALSKKKSVYSTAIMLLAAHPCDVLLPGIPPDL